MIEINDVVYVWDNGGNTKCIRHFAGLNDNGKPLVFGIDKKNIIVWDNCEKYTEVDDDSIKVCNVDQLIDEANMLVNILDSEYNSYAAAIVRKLINEVLKNDL